MSDEDDEGDDVVGESAGNQERPFKSLQSGIPHSRASNQESHKERYFYDILAYSHGNDTFALPDFLLQFWLCLSQLVLN